MNPEQHEFSRRVSATLDRSVEELDADTARQLQAVRQAALQPRQHNYRPAMMIAASLVALILVPWLTLHHPDKPAARPNVAADSAYLSVDPQMLSDWDMLDAIGEVPPHA